MTYVYCLHLIKSGIFPEYLTYRSGTSGTEKFHSSMMIVFLNGHPYVQ